MKGHACEQTSATNLSGKRHSPYSGGARCDLCCSPISGEQLLYHCEQCKYDLCPPCVNKISTCKICGRVMVRRSKEEKMFLDKYVSFSPPKCVICKMTIREKYLIECQFCNTTVCLFCYSSNVSNNDQHSIYDDFYFIGFCFIFIRRAKSTSSNRTCCHSGPAQFNSPKMLCSAMMLRSVARINSVM